LPKALFSNGIQGSSPPEVGAALACLLHWGFWLQGLPLPSLPQYRSNNFITMFKFARARQIISIF